MEAITAAMSTALYEENCASEKWELVNGRLYALRL